MSRPSRQPYLNRSPSANLYVGGVTVRKPIAPQVHHSSRCSFGLQRVEMTMQTPSNMMRRKIGAEEANEGFLFVEKNWLAKLPAPGTPFYLTVGKSQLKTRIIESGPCHCREPEHVHYRIALP